MARTSSILKQGRVECGQRFAQRVAFPTRTAVWEVGFVQSDAVPVPHARLVNVEDPLRTKTISCMTLANPAFYEFLGVSQVQGA